MDSPLKRIDKLESIGIHGLTIQRKAYNLARVQFSFPKDNPSRKQFSWSVRREGNPEDSYISVHPGLNHWDLQMPPNKAKVNFIVGFLKAAGQGPVSTSKYDNFWTGTLSMDLAQEDETSKREADVGTFSRHRTEETRTYPLAQAGQTAERLRDQEPPQDDLASLRSGITELQQDIAELRESLFDHINVNILTDQKRLKKFIGLDDGEEIQELRDQIAALEGKSKQHFVELTTTLEQKFEAQKKEVEGQLLHFEEKIEEKLKTHKTLEAVSQAITDLKVDDLKERILQDQSEILASREIDAEELRKASENLNAILTECTKLIPTSREPGDKDFLRKRLETIKAGIFSMLKRMEGVPRDFMAKELENLQLPRLDVSTSFLGNQGEVSFLDDSWTPPNPIAAYQKRLDRSLINTRSKYLEEKERILSSLFKNSVELRDAMDKFVSEVVFPFTETTLEEIQTWHEGLQGGRGRSAAEIEEVKRNIWHLCGIEEIPVREEDTVFDDKLHHKIGEEIHKNLPKNLVLKVRGKGYRIASSKKIIRKASVVLNKIYS